MLSAETIYDLELSRRTFNILRRNRLIQVDDIRNTSDESLLAFRGLGVSCLREIRDQTGKRTIPINQEVGVSENPWLTHEGKAGGLGLDVIPRLSGRLPPAGVNNLNTLFAKIPASPRNMAILYARFGPGKKQTLDEIGLANGLSRERVRQVIERTTERSQRSKYFLAKVFDLLEPGIPATHVDDKEPTASELRRICESALRSAGWQELDAKNIDMLLAVVRSICYAANEETEARWPNLTTAACILAPPVMQHRMARTLTESWEALKREESRRWTYQELAESVLESAGAELHWTLIADRAEAMGRRDGFSRSAIFNAMIGDPDKFTRVGPGTYALTAWGATTPRYYKDIIFDRLRKAMGHGTLTFGTIYTEVSAERPIKKGSLGMYLDLDPSFYRAMDGTYGLRARLLPRQKQTLRTPRALVEAPESYERVARSEAHGVRVDGVLALDQQRLDSLESPS